jgi:hypothetical protein
MRCFKNSKMMSSNIEERRKMNIKLTSELD